MMKLRASPPGHGPDSGLDSVKNDVREDSERSIDADVDPEGDDHSPQGSSRPAGLAKGKSTWVSSRPHLLQEIDAVTDAYANTDEAWTKTFSRIVVERYLQHKRWYFPRKDDTHPDAPKLTKAWAYYEHITLARYFIDARGNDRKKTRAEPGEIERETALYEPFTTPESDLNAWGIGVGLYFSTLRVVAVILIVAGLINIPSILYYAGPEYSDGQNGLTVFSLIGSAVCTSTEWVVCSDCPEDEWADTPEEQNRFGKTTDVDGSQIILVLRNACEGAQFSQGMLNWGTLFFLIICFGLLACFQRAREVRFDEDKLSAPDYSLVVKNPPKDAFDPDEWRDFFTQFAEKQVTCVTVALDNDQLVWKLTLRRIYREQLRLHLPKNLDLEDEDLLRAAVAEVEKEWESESKGCFTLLAGCTILPILRLFGLFLQPHVLVDRIFKLTEEIKELQKKHYNVCQVFVTFETEAGQRTAMSALSIPGKLDIRMNNTSRVAPSAIYKGRLLSVEEPTEPNAVRWMDIQVPTRRKLLFRFINLVITVGLISFAGFVVKRVRDAAGPALSAIFVTVFNSSIPQILKLLMLSERHSDEGTRQKSIYTKITLFRWVNTAILTKFITPFTSTIGPYKRGVLNTINAILWSELFVSPALRILDITGLFKKHVLAPRARNQEEMYLSFQGTPYHLAERYTDFTKVLFVCFFYSALFPSTFFFCGAILIVQYYADKFCLMRIWEPAPQIGTELAEFSRRYFFTGALLTFAIVSSYAWAQFPYDNICLPDDPSYGFDGTYDNVTMLNGTTTQVTVTQSQQTQFCNQEFRSYDFFSFPMTPRIQQNGVYWMSESQESLTTVYGWTSVVILILFVIVVFGGVLIKYILSWLKGMYQPSGEDQKIDFSNLAEISVYVPFVRIRTFPYPLLACDIDDIPQTLIGWNDKDNSYDVHNMIFDVPYEGMKRKRLVLSKTPGESRISDSKEYQESSDYLVTQEVAEQDAAGGKLERVQPRPIFSIVKHYPRFEKEK